MKTERNNTIPFAPNLVSCCIDSCSENQFTGRLYLNNVSEPYHFRDMHQMLIRIDDYFGEIKFPMKAMEYRSFHDKRVMNAGRRELKRIYDPEMLKNRGKVATFTIHVQYRQNCTWQGRIVWTDQNKVKYFRSCLEMVRLMDSALEAETYQENNVSKL